MHRWKEMSCITGKETRALQENKVMRCGKDIHALQEKDSCIIKRGTIHTQQENKVMHCGKEILPLQEKESCIARGKIHVQQKRTKSCIAENRFMYQAKRFMHHDKIACIARKRFMCYKRKKSCIVRDIYLSREENVKRIIKDDIERIINILHQPFITLTSNEEYFEDYIAIIRHKLICFTSNPMELMSNIKGEQLIINMVKDCLSFEMHFYAMSLISVSIKTIRKDEF